MPEVTKNQEVKEKIRLFLLEFCNSQDAFLLSAK